MKPLDPPEEGPLNIRKELVSSFNDRLSPWGFTSMRSPSQPLGLRDAHISEVISSCVGYCVEQLQVELSPKVAAALAITTTLADTAGTDHITWTYWLFTVNAALKKIAAHCMAAKKPDVTGG